MNAPNQGRISEPNRTTLENLKNEGFKAYIFTKEPDEKNLDLTFYKITRTDNNIEKRNIILECSIKEGSYERAFILFRLKNFTCFANDQEATENLLAHKNKFYKKKEPSEIKHRNPIKSNMLSFSEKLDVLLTRNFSSYSGEPKIKLIEGVGISEQLTFYNTSGKNTKAIDAIFSFPVSKKQEFLDKLTMFSKIEKPIQQAKKVSFSSLKNPFGNIWAR